MAKKKEVQFIGTLTAENDNVVVQIQISCTTYGALDESELGQFGRHLVRASAAALEGAPFSDFGIENIAVVVTPE